MLKARKRQKFIDVRYGGHLITSFDYVKRLPFSLDGQEYVGGSTNVLGTSYALFRGGEPVFIRKMASLLAGPG